MYLRKERDASLQTTKHSTGAYQGPEREKFPEIENEVLEYVRGLHNDDVDVLHEMLYFKSCGIATRQHMSPSQFKVIRDWIYCFMKRKGLSLRRRTSRSQRMPTYFDDNVMAFYRFVIGLEKKAVSTCCHK